MRHKSEPAVRPVPLEAVKEGARTLDLWADDALREEIDAHDMARRVIEAALPFLPGLSSLTDEEMRAIKLAIVFGAPDKTHDVLESARAKLAAELTRREEGR